MARTWRADMLLAKNNCFRGDLIYPQNQHRKITGSLMVLRRPGDVLHRDTYAAFLVPEGTVYRDLRTNLSAYLVNPGTLAACTGVPSAKKTDLYEYDVVRFGNQYDPYLIVYDREHLCFAIKNARQCLPLYACMGPELTILGNLFQDGDYLYESPLLDPWLYLKDAEQERLERVMFGSRYETDRQTIRDADESILQRALTAGEGRRGWLQGSLITLKGKTSSPRIRQRRTSSPAGSCRRRSIRTPSRGQQALSMRQGISSSRATASSMRRATSRSRSTTC